MKTIVKFEAYELDESVSSFKNKLYRIPNTESDTKDECIAKCYNHSKWGQYIILEKISFDNY